MMRCGRVGASARTSTTHQNIRAERVQERLRCPATTSETKSLAAATRPTSRRGRGRAWRRVGASSPSSGSSQAPPSGALDSLTEDGTNVQASAESESRLRYLEALVTLRTLYRTYLRARYWVEQPRPLLMSHPEMSGKDENESQGGPADQESLDEDEALAFALDALAEMALTSDQLSTQLCNVPGGFSAVLQTLSQPEGAGEKADGDDGKKKGVPSPERRVMAFGNALLEELASRLDEELEALPFATKKEAWAAVRKLITDEIPEEGEEDYDMVARESRASPRVKRSILQGQKAFRRVRRAEKAAERLVERVRSGGEGGDETGGGGEPGLNATKAASYAKGVWIRLNGGGKTGLDAVPLPEDLPRPARISGEARRAFSLGSPSEIISISVDKLDKELKVASKVREAKLRSAGVLERARMASLPDDSGTSSSLKEAEENVNNLRMELALKTLQLELRLVFEYLEKEALQIIDENGNFLPWRRGSSEELTLLVAEYALLDRKTTSLAQYDLAALSREGRDLVAELATDVPDLRMRLGITDNEVVYMSLDTRIKNLVLIAEDSVQKVRDSFVFMGTGSKLLVTDITTCGKLFWRALLGGTLQPREVETLRRTARDVLTFVPFIVILILPITPVGHVLVFSFIQQNFPALFPSQFTSARQKSMRRYEDLKKQLDSVMEEEGLKWREEQFNRAVEAVEALTANVTKEGGEAKQQISLLGVEEGLADDK